MSAEPSPQSLPLALVIQERTSSGSCAAKRLLDVTVSAVLLVVLLPIIALLAVATLVDSGRPVLFVQARIGRDGRPFRMLKLRTMVRAAEALEEALRSASLDPDWLLLDRDPRITRLGRLLRRASLDELPQLWNILRGDMSLVGLRPLSLADHGRVPSWARERDLVRPGLTGSWQVSGRTAVPFATMLELDVAYVRACSMRGDVVLLCRTVPAVLRSKGAN